LILRDAVRLLRLVWRATATALIWLDGLVAELGYAVASCGRWLYQKLEWLQSIPRAMEGSRLRNPLFAGLTIAAAFLLTVLAGLNAVLRDLHRLGGEVFDIGALANGLFSFPDADRFREVLLTWNEMAGVADSSSKAILTTYAIVDIAFVFVYALLVGMVLIALDKALEQSGPSGPGRETVDSIALEQTAAATKRLTTRPTASPSDWDSKLAEERERLQTTAASSRIPLQVALGALGVLVVADILENVLIFFSPRVESNSAETLVAWSIWFATRLKVLALVLVVVPALIALLTLLVDRPLRRRHLWTALVVVRGGILVVAILFAGLFISDQSVDAVRRWRDDGWDAGFATTLLAWTAVVVVGSMGALLRLSTEPRPRRESPVRLVSLALLAGVLSILAWWQWDAWLGLATLGGLLVVIAVLSAPLGDLGRDRREADADLDPSKAAAWLPALLGIAVCILPALAIVRAATAPVVLRDFPFDGAMLKLALPAGFLLLFAAVLAYTSSRLARLWQNHPWWLIIPSSVVVLYIVGRIYTNPLRISEALGTVAFLATFLLAATLVLYAAARRAERVRPPKAISLLRLDRTPFILLAVVWVVATAQLDTETTYHDVRTLSRDTSPPGTVRAFVTPRDALSRWINREPASRKQRPLLFVAAAGGGIRAAYWTATVLTCVLEGSGKSKACSEGSPRANERGTSSLFAASGISGGSLGLAAYVAHLEADKGVYWPKRRLAGDYTAPVIAWGLFADLPSAVVRRSGGRDRVAILEQAFERSWLEKPSDRTVRGVLWGGMPSTDATPLAEGLVDSWALQSKANPIPVLMLNGTKVQEGCRLNVSVLEASVDSPSETPIEDCLSLRLFEAKTTPEDVEQDIATREKWTLASSDDLSRYLCAGEDVRLSTAVMLSARFPFVVPSGRLPGCREMGTNEDVEPANVVDGGYFDTSGASPLVELWGNLAHDIDVKNAERRCIAPFFLQIDTGYADPVKTGDRSPQEILVPPTAVRRARDAREHNARQAAALLFNGALELGPEIRNRYAHIYPRAHPGVRAPLGWTLSDAAQDELDDQLDNNKEEIRKVRSWLSNDTPCPKPSQP
jgi:hypothetical protein